MTPTRSRHVAPTMVGAAVLSCLFVLGRPAQPIQADDGPDDVVTILKKELAKMREQLRIEIRADLQQMLDERDQRLRRHIDDLLSRHLARRGGGGGGGGASGSGSGGERKLVKRIVIRSHSDSLPGEGDKQEHFDFNLEFQGDLTPEIQKALDDFEAAVAAGRDPEQALARLKKIMEQHHQDSPEAPEQSPHSLPFLGVSLGGIDTLPEKSRKDVESGLVVVSVVAGSPAEKAGLKGGDVITAVNKQPVTTFAAFASLIAKHRPGDRITISLYREGWQKVISLELGKREDR